VKRACRKEFGANILTYDGPIPGLSVFPLLSELAEQKYNVVTRVMLTLDIVVPHAIRTFSTNHSRPA